MIQKQSFFAKCLVGLKSGCLKADLNRVNREVFRIRRYDDSPETVHDFASWRRLDPDNRKLVLSVLVFLIFGGRQMTLSENKKSFAVILALEGFLVAAYAVQSLLDLASVTNDWFSSITLIAGF